MDVTRHERLISSIYDFAVDEDLLADALLNLAAATNCRQASLEVYAPGTTHFIAGRNPFLPPDYRESYLAYWYKRVRARKSTDSFPVGQMINPLDVWRVDALKTDPYFNEFVKPQGMGGQGRYANIARTSRATAVLGAFKAAGSPEFKAEEHRAFAMTLPHFVRAATIRRRLRVAEAQRSAAGSGGAPPGFLVVDERGHILAADDTTRRRLHAAGLVASATGEGRVINGNPALDRLIFGAAGHSRIVSGGGQFDHAGPDGSLLRISVIPLSEKAQAYDPWFAIDGPAALVCVRAPQDSVRERVSQLAAEFGLTPAEAIVALEAAKGDGRAAVAARLGIRETTVRSHLSAIFDKLGIHRQAELTRIVTGS